MECTLRTCGERVLFGERLLLRDSGVLDVMVRCLPNLNKADNWLFCRVIHEGYVVNARQMLLIQSRIRRLDRLKLL